MRMPYKIYCGLVSLLALTGAGSTWAQDSSLVYASRPADILNIAKGFGSATLEKDSVGDPSISGRINGTKYGIYFYGCSNNKSCKSIQFAAAWNTKKSSAEYEQWNSKKRYGKVYSRDDSTVLQFDVELEYGMPQRNLEEVFRDFELTLKSVKKDLLDLD